jgi:hypothetical protein
LEKFNALQDEYKEFCVLTLVNKVDKNWEVHPTIKLVRVK